MFARKLYTPEYEVTGDEVARVDIVGREQQ